MIYILNLATKTSYFLVVFVKLNSKLAGMEILILIVNWQDSRLSITPMFHSD